MVRGLARGETGEASGREGDGPRVGAEGGDDGVDRRRTENETARFERRGGVGALETRTREWATAHLANIPRVRVVHGARPTVRRAAPARSPVRDRARCAMKGEAVDGQRSRRARSERSSRLISPSPRVRAGRLVRTGKEEFRLLVRLRAVERPFASRTVVGRVGHVRRERALSRAPARPRRHSDLRDRRRHSPRVHGCASAPRPPPDAFLLLSPPLTPPPFALASQPRTSSPRSRTRRTRLRRSAPPRTCAASAGRCTSPSATRDSTAAGSSRCTSSSTSGSRARR